jgi:hypothetical protein
LCIGVHECPRSLDYTLRRGRAGPVGAVMTILFEIEGQQFLARFSFNLAISLIVKMRWAGRG